MGCFTSEHLEPYNYQWFGTSMYAAVRAPPDRVMALSGWSCWEMVKSPYLAGSLVATPAMVSFYGWLARPAVAVATPARAFFVPLEAPDLSARPQVINASVGHIDLACPPPGVM